MSEGPQAKNTTVQEGVVGLVPNTRQKAGGQRFPGEARDDYQSLDVYQPRPGGKSSLAGLKGMIYITERQHLGP